MDPEAMDWEPCGMDKDVDLVPSESVRDMADRIAFDQKRRTNTIEGDSETADDNEELGPPGRKGTVPIITVPQTRPLHKSRVEPVPPDDEEFKAEAAAPGLTPSPLPSVARHFESLDQANTEAAETLDLRRQPLDVDMGEIARSPED